MLFADFLLKVLTLCRNAGIHTAVDTAGNVPFSRFEAVCNSADLFLFDVKCMDPERHKQGTGVSNGLILENLRRLSAARARIIIRIPVVPGFNDLLEELGAAARWIASLPRPVELVQLLPYHSFGSGKYQGMGIPCPMKTETPPSNDFMKEALSRFQALGIPSQIS